MKHIRKKIANEPASLHDYRNNTPNPTYNGGGFNAIELKKALLEEQGYICAYCMGRISLDTNERGQPNVVVEHLFPRESYPERELDYMNMLAVCTGLHETFPDRAKVHHCDKTKGNDGKMNGTVVLRKLNPLSKTTCEDLIDYTAEGLIKSKTADADVEHDINVVLNLNNQYLVRNRKLIIDQAKGMLIEEKPDKNWTKEFFEKHIEIWQTKYDGKHRIYYMIAVWFLNRLKANSKYK